jgi:NADH dehydrogenase
MKRVIIVGGGFAGLNAARGLARGRKAEPLEITVIDRRNHHLFQPLLYQVAMAGLSPAEISAPIRSLLSGHRNLRVRQEEIRSVDLAGRRIRTDGAELPYDYLLLACGAEDNYFGHEDWEPFAPGLKSLEQATEIRRRVLTAYEQAEIEPDPERRRALLTFVVVGGGPTGVEIAGALGEMSRFTLARDFHRIDPKNARVLLIEAGARILPSFDSAQAGRAARDLESLGVQIWTESPVTAIDAEGVELGRERIQAGTVVWAAGVQAAALNRELGVPLDRQGRVLVEPDLSLAEHPEVFVMGDQARVGGEDEDPLPGVAPVAIQQGRHVARNLRRELRGEPREPFRYLDKGQMATIGRRRAVAQVGRLRFAGFFAWLVWLVIHIYFLSGFKNRLFVMLQWAWSYVTFGRGARLIVGRPHGARPE